MNPDTYYDLDILRYQNKFQEIIKKSNFLKQQQITNEELIWLDFLILESEIKDILKTKQILEKDNSQQQSPLISKTDIELYSDKIAQFTQKYQLKDELVDTAVLQSFLSQINMHDFNYENFEDSLQNLPSLKRLQSLKFYKSLSLQPYRVISILEIYLLKLSSERYGLTPDEISIEIQSYLEYIIQQQNNPKIQQIQDLQKTLKKLKMISICRYIQSLNFQQHTPYQQIQKLLSFLKLDSQPNKILLGANPQQYNIDLQIFILYKICQYILIYISQKQSQKLNNYLQEILNTIQTIEIQTLNQKNNLQQKNIILSLNILQQSCKSWESLLIFLIASIHELVETKNQKFQQINLKKSTPQKSLFQKDLDRYICYNFTQIRNKIKKKLALILQHKLASLIEIFSLKIHNKEITKCFMEYMMASPFEDDILSMKVCLQLYEQQEYAKLYQLIHQILASESIIKHPFRPILLAMSSIFTGIKLGKHEEGLTLSRLNFKEQQDEQEQKQQHQQQQQQQFSPHNFHTRNSKQFILQPQQYSTNQNLFSQNSIQLHHTNNQANINTENNLNNIQQQSEILFHETRVTHIGYSFYNLARQSVYTYNAQNYTVKAIEYLEQGCTNNYTAHFTLAKCYAKKNKLEQASDHIKESIRLNKSNLNAFLILALIYSAKGKLQHSEIIINQLLIDNPNIPNLYIFKAYLETEKYLWRNEKTLSIDIADEFGKGTREQLIEEKLKGKEISYIITNMVIGCVCLVHPDFYKDKNFEADHNFHTLLDKLSALQDKEIMPSLYINYKNALSLFVDLLFSLEYYEPINPIIEKMNDGIKKNKIEYNYYVGLLYEKKEKDYEAAYQTFEDILRDDFYHFKTMTQLAMVYLKYFQDDKRKTERAQELLIAASKIEETAEICYGFGLLYEKLGDMEKSNHYLIRSLEISKSTPILPYDTIPDQLFTL